MKRHRPRARRGYTLVFFAMFLFGFMALAALVIDVGFARLTQRQMQTAVDAAALEGLRFRDRDEVPEDLVHEMVEAGVNPDDASDPDYARRWLASRIVAWTFDDNLNPNDGDLIGFGAGPLVELGPPIEGAEDLKAGQLLRLPDTPFYKPRRSDGIFGLEPNLDDEVYGDMVAGAYDPDEDHDEEPDYTRVDFKTPGDSAFLVRMRRTNNFGGLDRVDEVSSHGPPIPFLFGLGAFLPGPDPNTGYSPRHHGMTVRATAIARQERVRSVGMPDSTRELAGLAEFALDLDYWDSLENDVADEQDLTDGVIGDELGQFYTHEPPPQMPPQPPPQMPVVIGRSLPDRKAPEDGSYTGYVPIYTDISGVPRVIGFGSADAVVATDGNTRTVEITRKRKTIAAENASAIVCYKWDVNGDDLMDVWEANRNLPDPLLAPVSVR